MTNPAVFDIAQLHRLMERMRNDDPDLPQKPVVYVSPIWAEEARRLYGDGVHVVELKKLPPSR